MTIIYHNVLLLWSYEWLMAWCGLLTASEVKYLVTPKTLKVCSNEKSISHTFEIMAQRLNGFVEDSYVSSDMLRGTIDEIEARNIYSKEYAPVVETGFITNDKWGFTIGYSPDGILIEGEGSIEIKSRKQKLQTKTIVENEMPSDFLIQVQTGLLVSEKEWCDFISYCSGTPLFVKRIYPDEKVQDAIIAAAENFEKNIAYCIEKYKENSKGFIMTERKVYEDEIILN